MGGKKKPPKNPKPKKPTTNQPSSWSPCLVIPHCPRWSCIEGMAGCACGTFWEVLERSFQVCSPRLSPFQRCGGWRGGSNALSGAGAAPNGSGICLMRLGVSFLGGEGRSLQQLNAMKTAWCRKGKNLPEGSGIEMKKTCRLVMGWILLNYSLTMSLMAFDCLRVRLPCSLLSGGGVGGSRFLINWKKMCVCFGGAWVRQCKCQVKYWL